MTEMTGHQPLRAALAWVLTMDQDFVEYVLKDHRLERSDEHDPLDAPLPLSGMLGEHMKSDDCLILSPNLNIVQSKWPGDQIVIVNPAYTGRFRRFADKARIDSEGMPFSDYVRRVILPLVHDAVSGVCRHIKNGTLTADAVAVDGGIVGKAGRMKSSFITDTMTLGNDGKLHQEGGERQEQVPAYKQVTVLWKELLQCFPNTRPTTLASATDQKASGRGRKTGDGSYNANDAPVLEWMKTLIDLGHAKSPNEAATMLSDRTRGQSPDARRDRLQRKYKSWKRGGFPEPLSEYLSNLSRQLPIHHK